MLQCFQVLHFMVFVEKILCIRVLECELIRLRDVIWGTSEAKCISSRKYAVLWSFSYFSKSILNSSIKMIPLFISECSFRWGYLRIIDYWIHLLPLMNGDKHIQLWCFYCLKWLFQWIYTFFLIRKPFFSLSLNFISIMLEIRLRFSWYFFLNFLYLFSLILYLIRFITNNKRHFLNNGDRHEF